jgi:uncharacterized cupin superfamily protein
MNAKLAVSAVLAAAAVTLTSVAGASLEAAKQRVAITMKGLPNGTFVLTPLKAGALKRDSGTVSVVSGDSRVVVRDGQKVAIFAGGIYTFKGKRGSLTIRERTEWVDIANENAPGFSFPPAVGTGSWKVLRGTGTYAEIAGGGRSGHAGLGAEWYARQEGFLTLP